MAPFLLRQNQQWGSTMKRMCLHLYNGKREYHEFFTMWDARKYYLRIMEFRTDIEYCTINGVPVHFSYSDLEAAE